jgi:uncharacterized peroxidase-related enzyme
LLAKQGKDEAARDRTLDGLVQDHTHLDLSTKDRAMLDYAAKLTRRPGEMTERDVAALRDAGFDDRAIHDICAVTAYFAFVNRIADGLGVEVEGSEE